MNVFQHRFVSKKTHVTELVLHLFQTQTVLRFLEHFKTGTRYEQNI
jgi:hypothetical protein